MSKMPQERLIPSDRSVIIACDVDVGRFEDIVRQTCNFEEIGSYKIGAALALSVGLKEIVKIARRYTTKPLIYDHQKASTDIPDTAEEFVKVIKDSGIEALILFPLSGPETQATWINAAHNVGLWVLSGGLMTHPKFLSNEGGYIKEDAVKDMYIRASHHHVRDYIVPGNKPDKIGEIRKWLMDQKVDPIFYIPGLISQGGIIAEAAKAAGHKWHAIVGRAIYGATDIQDATRAVISQLS